MPFKSIAKAVCTTSEMMTRALAASIVFIVASSPVFVTEARSAQITDKFPFLITCEYKGMVHAFYLSRVDAEGVATYVTPSRLAGTISVGGTAKALGEPSGGSCLDKTLDELRASGQALDLGR
jgi:hypothetical protein